MPPPPGDPLYWASPPSSAVFHPGGDLSGWSRGWTVASVPPPPWPYLSGPYDYGKYGPPGTIWLYNLDDAADQISHVPVSWAETLINAVRKKLGLLSLGDIPWYYEVPAREGLLVSTSAVIRMTIHGKIGTTEEIAHTSHWVKAGTGGGDPFALGDLDAIGPAAVAAWKAFLIAPTTLNGSPSAPRVEICSTLTYDSVQLAALTLAPPAKPNYDIRTRYYPLDAGADAPTGGQNLPWEVAHCISMTTAQRGARYRGRMYLGPLSVGCLSSSVPGTFDADFAHTVAAAYATKFLSDAGLRALADPVIASYKYGTVEPITGVKGGIVPDSMRSRRRSQNEQYSAITAVT